MAGNIAFFIRNAPGVYLEVGAIALLRLGAGAHKNRIIRRS